MNYIGIDGSGKYTKLVMMDENRKIIGRHSGGSTDIKNTIYSAAENNLKRIISEAYRLTNKGIANCKGVCFACDRKVFSISENQIIKMVKSMGFVCTVKVISEDRAILSAKTEAGPGALLMSGADINGYILGKDGKELFTGGYGFHAETGGSAYSVGMNAIRAVLKAYDGRAEETLLTDKVKRYFAVKEISSMLSLINEMDYDLSKIAELALIVKSAAAEGDKAAIEIEKQAAKDIGDFAAGLVNLTRKQGSPLTLVLGGSFLNINESIQRQAAAAIRHKFSDVQVVSGDGKSENGAAFVALKL